MPPQYRRFAPLLLVALLLFVLVPLLRHKSSSGISDKIRSARTHDALKRIDTGEMQYRAAHGRYTDHVADLVASTKGLGFDLAIGLGVQLDVSSDGATYIAQLESSVLSLVRARTGDVLKTNTCLKLKSSSGVIC